MSEYRNPFFLFFIFNPPGAKIIIVRSGFRLWKRERRYEPGVLVSSTTSTAATPTFTCHYLQEVIYLHLTIIHLDIIHLGIIHLSFFNLWSSSSSRSCFFLFRGNVS